MRLILVTTIILAAVFAAPARAGTASENPTLDGIGLDELFPGQRFDPAIPTQEQVIGRRPGAWPMTHDEMKRYLTTLAEASDRARLETYSTSHEGREMMLFAVSDPATVARLDDFQAEHRDRVDPRGRQAADDAAALDGAKAVAWMGYSIHGDELSGGDAAAAVAYFLVAGEGGAAEQLRRDLVILIDPLENPDGRDRYIAMLRSFQHAQPTGDLEDLSHTAVWPWGRGNHYLFDLNRDWFSLVHPESVRSTYIAGWNPQLMVDAHEMGSDDSYLFSPSRHPFNPFLPPNTEVWAGIFGRDQAKRLDGRGYDYYTREWNEEFFPGYGSSWASYLGAVGILYEMSGTEGQWATRSDGVRRTFGQAVEHQTVSSVANLETLAKGRADILRDFVADRRAVITASQDGQNVAAYVLPEGDHPDRTRELVRLLRRQGIDVVGQDALPPALSATSITDGKPLEADGPVWIVPLDQPASPLIRVLLDPHVPMSASFLVEQREYLERNKGSRLYDATAWSLPLLYGIEAGWTRKPVVAYLPRERDAAPAEMPAGRFTDAADAFGYLVDSRNDASLAAIAELMQNGVTVQVIDKPVTIEGRDWARGTYLVETGHNEDHLARELRGLVERHGVDVTAISTALAEEGPDLGGSHVKLLREPRIGVWTGWPISPTSYGALWLQLDRAGIRFNGLDVGRARSVDLSRYNVLVFPDAFSGAGGYRSALGGGGLAALKSWIEAGGTAIGIGAGSEFLAQKQTELTTTRLRAEALDLYPPVVWGPSADLAEEGFRFRAVGLKPESDAPAEDDDAERESKSKSRRNAKAKRDRVPAPSSPYDVAPVIGPGALPFVEGVDLGTPVAGKPVALSEWIKPLLPAGRSAAKPEDIARADRRLRGFRPEGALVKVELDPEHWINWGAGESIPALVSRSDTLVADAPVEVPARFADLDTLHHGGLLWPEAAARLALTAYATRERRGRGQIVLFLNEPEFRGWTLATRRLWMNAIVLGPGLGTSGSRPW